jgi:CRISPR-associated endonuclease/helicase Cas3
MCDVRQETNSSNMPAGRLLLPGLDGSNPLGFLASLGLLRTLTDLPGLEKLSMSWTPSGGTWIPALYPAEPATFDEGTVLDLLLTRLVSAIRDHPSNLLDQFNLASDDQSARRKVIRNVADGTDRTRMDWSSAIASDFAASDAISQLQTTRRDYFYGNLESVIGRTNREHLRRAIFCPWDYADSLDNQSLHVDPSEDRRHAYQWNKPAGDPERKVRGGMLGANRLALEAIPLFPSFPENEKLHTVGFTGTRSTNTRWTWPIWNAKVKLPVVRSLVASSLLQKEILGTGDVGLLRAQGIVAVYRSRRILVEKTPNFTRAKCIA